MRLGIPDFSSAARFAMDIAAQSAKAVETAGREVQKTATHIAKESNELGQAVLRGNGPNLFSDAMSGFKIRIGLDLTSTKPLWESAGAMGRAAGAAGNRFGAEAQRALNRAARQLVGPVVENTLMRVGAPLGLVNPILRNLTSLFPQVNPVDALQEVVGPLADGAKQAVEQGLKAAGEFADGAIQAASGLVIGDPADVARDGEVIVVVPEGWTGGDVDPNDPNAIHYVNGVGTSFGGAESDARALANQTGRPVVFTYNASDGFVSDVLQSAGDKFTFGLLGQNKATLPLSEQMYQAAKGGQPVDFVPYSQGTIIARNALMVAHARLYTEKYVQTLTRTMNPIQAALEADQFARESMQNVKVTTAAPAAWLWPDYANVHHVTNVNDLFVANPLGQPAFTDPRELANLLFGDVFGSALLGTRDDLHLLNETDGAVNHSFQRIYLDDVANLL